MNIKLLHILTLCGVAGLQVSAAHAGTIADWTFEASQPAGTGAAISNIQAETYALSGSATASGVHASASTAYSSPSGNGSTHSFSSNNWSINDYYQFQLATTGYQNIDLSWDQAGSSTGPKTFKLQYSTDGSNFTTFGSDYTVNLSNWSPSSVMSGFTNTVDLSSVPALDNAASIYIRLVDDSTGSIGNGTVGTPGTDRVDNFSVSGTQIAAVPEPSVTAALMLGGILLAVLRRKISVRA